MKSVLASTISTLPEELARSLTWDRGNELSAHAQFKVETGIAVFRRPAVALAARHEREHEQAAGLVPESWTPYLRILLKE